MYLRINYQSKVVVRYKTQMCCCGKSRAHKRGGGGHGKHGKAKKKRKVLHKCKDCGHRYATKDRLRKHREKKHHGHRRRDNDDDNNDDEIVDQQPISIIADVFMVDPNQQTGQYSVDGTGSAYEMTVGTTGDIFTSNIGGQPMAQLGLNSTPQDGTDEGCNCCGGGCDGDESCCETLCGALRHCRSCPSNPCSCCYKGCCCGNGCCNDSNSNDGKDSSCCCGGNDGGNDGSNDTGKGNGICCFDGCCDGGCCEGGCCEGGCCDSGCDCNCSGGGSGCDCECSD